uniref:Uncharacterized protein n=1 Tax=Rhizophagus irregularis (strain DAOM 181602 / DAOM 197198 / MUCL 43194) TaxID=747089 RepID=U9UU10_RHIID
MKKFVHSRAGVIFDLLRDLSITHGLDIDLPFLSFPHLFTDYSPTKEKANDPILDDTMINFQDFN